MAFHPHTQYVFGAVRGAYNPRHHLQAAKDAGFDVGGDDGQQPKTLYVGNLDLSVNEEFLGALFGKIGPVTKIKVFFDDTSDPYAFVQFDSHDTAAQALTAMNRRSLHGKEMVMAWVTQPDSRPKIDTSGHFHVFVGDLSPEVDNKALKEAFAPFGEISNAQVKRDFTTLKSKGYGFVSYPKREDAARAIDQMNGHFLGRRAIRTNWATRKTGGGAGGQHPSGGQLEHPGRELTYEDVFNQTGPDNCSVYVGGLPPNCSNVEIGHHFEKFGRIMNIRHFKEHCNAFIQFAKKEFAARAIFEMNGADVGGLGLKLKCNWGKNEATRSHGSGHGGPSIPGSHPAAFGGGPTPLPDFSELAKAHAQYWHAMQSMSTPEIERQQQEVWQNYWERQRPPSPSGTSS